MNVERRLPELPTISKQTEKAGWILAVLLFVLVDSVMTAGGYYTMMLQLTPIWAETNPVMVTVVYSATDLAAKAAVYSAWGETIFALVALLAVKSIAVGVVYSLAQWSSRSGARYVSLYGMSLMLVYGLYTLVHTAASFAVLF